MGRVSPKPRGHEMRGYPSNDVMRTSIGCEGIVHLVTTVTMYYLVVRLICCPGD